MTAEWTGTKFWPFNPTDCVSPNFSDFVLGSDGYGQSFVHGFDKKTGAYTNMSFGGNGKSETPQQFSCPHGINFDYGSNLTVVADRSNNRIEFCTIDGNHVRTVNMNSSSLFAKNGCGILPCNVDYGYPGYALIPYLDGPVAVVDATVSTVVSVIQV